MNAVVLVIEDDAEGDPYDGVGTSNESMRTATPLSFQTFGHDSPRNSPRNNDIDHLHIPDATRPSLDSYQSSSPSTAPPTTPTRLDGSEQSIGKSSPVTSSPPMTPQSNSPTVEQPRTLRSKRIPGASGEPLAEQNEDDHNTSQEKTGTLRRTNPNKRKPRPMLGVSTFATANSPITIEPSPLSPVIASPRSNRTRGDAPQSPSITYIPAPPPSSHSLDEMAALEPMSPDVTLDLPTSQYVFMPGTDSSGPHDVVSPFGTTFLTEAPAVIKASPEKEKGGAKLHYKPRRRVPTPKNRSTMVQSTAIGTSAPGSFRLGGTTADALAERNAASLSREQGRALHDQAYAQDTDKGRRSSLGRWSFANPENGIMRRLSRLRSSTDLRPEAGESVVKSAVEPPSTLGHRPALSMQDVPDLRGYASDGVHGRRRSSGLIGARLSKILPIQFQGRRQSVQQQQQRSNSSAADAQLEEDEEGDIHLWATAAALSHGTGSVPLARPARLSNAGSGSADGAHRHSTITVRSSDGWFTTVPSSSVSLSLPGNGSPIAANFTGLGNDLSRQNSPASHNPSRSSLTFAPAPPQLHPHHSISDPTTPTLATLAAAGVSNRNEGSSSRRYSEQQAPVSVADLLKPPSSQRSSLTAGYTPKLRPQSLQQPVPPIENGQTPVTKVELLNGIQHGPDSVRLLDVETAAAIRRSIELEDRVRKGESVLRRALYGSESSSAPISSSSRSSSFSAASASGMRGRGRNAKPMERSSSIGSGTGVHVSADPRSGSVERPRAVNGLATGGGVFLSNTATRSPRTAMGRYMNNSGSSSGISTPFHPGHDTGYATLRNGLRSTSGTLSRGSSTLREEHEETFGKGKDDKFGVEFGVDVGVAGKSVQSPTLARRVGRRISRIFVAMMCWTFVSLFFCYEDGLFTTLPAYEHYSDSLQHEAASHRKT